MKQWITSKDVKRERSTQNREVDGSGKELGKDEVRVTAWVGVGLAPDDTGCSPEWGVNGVPAPQMEARLTQRSTMWAGLKPFKQQSLRRQIAGRWRFSETNNCNKGADGLKMLLYKIGDKISKQNEPGSPEGSAWMGINRRRQASYFHVLEADMFSHSKI